jgi:hypothetical protein
MVTDKQVMRLMMMINKEKTQAIAVSKARMDEKTARKYLELGRLPSQLQKDHTYQTRKDPIEGVWDELDPFLDEYPALEASTCFVISKGNTLGDLKRVRSRHFREK